jgi:RNA polymerase sigma-70 factor (ECF subfamily)
VRWEREAPFRALLAGGDQRGAAAWLVRQHVNDVLGLCVAMVRDRALAEDLAQDAFSRAFAGLSGYRADASASTWLLAVARNRCLDHLRQARRDPWAGASLDEEASEVPDDAPLPPEQILRRADVGAALSALSEGERALVVLRYKSELEYAELAEAFGLQEGTVRMRLSRALGRMRAALAARDGDALPRAMAPGAPPAPAAAPAPARRARALSPAPRAPGLAGSGGWGGGAVRSAGAPALPGGGLLDAFVGEVSPDLRARLFDLAERLPQR